MCCLWSIQKWVTEVVCQCVYFSSLVRVFCAKAAWLPCFVSGAFFSDVLPALFSQWKQLCRLFIKWCLLNYCSSLRVTCDPEHFVRFALGVVFPYLKIRIECACGWLQKYKHLSWWQFSKLNAFIFWDIPVFCIWKPAKWKNSSPVQSLILWWYIWVAEWDDLSVEVTGLD